MRVKRKKSVISQVQEAEGLGEAGGDRRGGDEPRKAISKRSHNLGDPQSVVEARSVKDGGRAKMAMPMTEMGQ